MGSNAPARSSDSRRCLLAIKAVPNAARSEIVGWLGDALKVRLQAPPVEGKANAELLRFLAEVLRLPRHAVTLSTGASARAKRVAIEGLTRNDVSALLAQE